MKSRTVEGTTTATGFQRALSWIMAVVMAVSLMPLPAYAAGSENATGGGSSLQGAPAGLTALGLNTQSFDIQEATNTFDASADAPVITTQADWDAFAAAVTGGATFEGKTVSIAKDAVQPITVSSPVGEFNSGMSKAKAFLGSFDGNGKTLTFNIASPTTGNGSLFPVLGGEYNSSTYAFARKGTITISNLILNGTIGSVTNAAALIGRCYAKDLTVKNVGIDMSLSSGESNNYAAGFIAQCPSQSGATGDPVTFNNCYMKGSVVGKSYVAAFIAQAMGRSVSLTDCYNMATITGYATSTNAMGNVAGLVVLGTSATVTYKNTYQAANVSMGNVISSSAVSAENCYYDSNVNSTVTDGTANFTAKTTEELKGLATTLGDAFVADADSTINNGYPILKWEAGEQAVIPDPVTYAITKEDATNGSYTVTVDGNAVESASEGAMVVVTPTPSENYLVDAVTVTDADSNTVSTTESGGAYSFTMPAKAVTVTVTFKAASNKINVPTAVTGLSYTGNAQTVVAGGTGYTLAFAEGAPSDAAVDASGNATLTNATESSLAVTATLKSGYTWSDDSADAKTIDVSMGKGANPAMTVAPATVSLLDTETTGKTSTVSYAGTGELSARSANDGVATATVSGSNVTIIPVAAGETAVTVTAAAGSNYTAASTATINVTVVDASTLTVKVTPLAKGSALQADANYIITSRSASDNAVMGASGTTQSARTATIDEAAETIAFSSATDKEESIWTAEASGESFKLKTAGGKYLGIAATGLSINDSGTDLIWKDFYNGENDYSSVQTKTVLHSTMYGYVKYESGIFSQLLNSQPSSAAAKIWKVVDTTARNITVPNGITGGTVAVDKKQAAENDVVTVTVTPDTGYEIDKVTYTPEGGSTTPIEAKDGAYTFAMPAANVAVSATFKLKSYTITWTDDEGKTIKTTEVAHGTVPAFGDDPEKAGTDQYTYTFDSWDPVPVAATQNATYKAKFTSTVNKYTVKFVNEGGAELQSSEVEYGATPTYNGNTPTKEATSEYTYKFKGWDSEIAAVTGDATYTAQFEAIPIDQPTTEKFKVTFVDEDGETVLKAAEYAEGTAAADIVKPVDPTKAPTAEYEYAFDKWVNAADDSEMAVVTQDVTYKATYTATKRSYTVTFKNGSATLQSAPVEYGATPAYAGETPTKAADAEYTYEFEGWEPELASVTGEATYTAKFKATPIDQPTTDKFTVTFVDEDGTVLKEAEYAEGTAAADIVKPADPAKASTAEFDYAFAGWSPEIAPVTANATYKATYTAKKRSYTVTFKNGDQTLQSTSVEYGAMPAYAGTTPAKAADSQHTYVFKGWTPAIAKVTGNATYAAEFTALTKVAKPTAKSFTYDGATKSIVAGKGYSLTGTKSAVNAGTYKATAKLSSGYVWADGTTSDVTVSWSIGKAKVAKPAGKSYTYDGTTKTGVAAGAGYTLTGVDKASNAGTYSATAKLDSNHAWSDGSSASAVISWKVSPASIAKAAIAKVVAMTYTGKALTPTPKVTLSGKQLALNADYTLSYAGNKNAGTAAITVTGKGNYTGTAKSSFTIKKAASKLTVKAKKTLTVSKSAAKTVFNAKNVWKTTKNTSKGALSYKKTSGDKRITVASNGKVTVKKGLKKGKTYTVKVKATSKATGNYKAASSTVKLKVKVK